MKFLALIEKNQNAIIGALIIHVLVFVWLNIQNISFYVIQPKEKTIATFDFTEITKPINNIDDSGNEPIAPIKLTNAASNYDQNQELSASQKQQLEQQIINEVKKQAAAMHEKKFEDGINMMRRLLQQPVSQVTSTVVNKNTSYIVNV